MLPSYENGKDKKKRKNPEESQSVRNVVTAVVLMAIIWILLQKGKTSEEIKPFVVEKPDHASVMKEPLDANRTLKIVTVSDMHSSYRHFLDIKIPKADLLIIAGDSVIEDNLEGVFLGNWINSLKVKHGVVVLGNRDIEGATTTSLRALEKSLNGSTLIHDEVVTVMGYRIFGSAYTPFYTGAFQLYTEAERRAYWDRVLPNNTDVDIIVTHGPPFGFGDSVPRRGHKGDPDLLRAVQNLQKKPLLWVCGHIHEAHGVYSVPHPQGEIPLINAAVAELGKGEVAARPRVVEMPGVKISQPTEEEVAQELGEDFHAWKMPLFSQQVYG